MRGLKTREPRRRAAPDRHKGIHSSTGTVIGLRFPGQWFQQEAGLHQNWMRDYDPTLGRYVQADPLGLVDGASVYNYVSLNPHSYIDPRGERGVGVQGGSFGVVTPPVGFGVNPHNSVPMSAWPQYHAPPGVEENSCSPVDCYEIYRQIEDALNDVLWKFGAWNADPRRLVAGMPPMSRRAGSFGGHVQQIWNKQRRLENLIKQAKEQGCYDIPQGAEEWAARPVPFNGAIGGQ